MFWLKKRKYIVNLQIFNRRFLKVSNYSSFFFSIFNALMPLTLDQAHLQSRSSHSFLGAHPRNTVKHPGEHPGLLTMDEFMRSTRTFLHRELFEGRSLSLLALCKEGLVLCLYLEEVLNESNCP